MRRYQGKGKLKTTQESASFAALSIHPRLRFSDSVQTSADIVHTGRERKRFCWGKPQAYRFNGLAPMFQLGLMKNSVSMKLEKEKACSRLSLTR